MQPTYSYPEPPQLLLTMSLPNRTQILQGKAGILEQDIGLLAVV